MNINLELYKVFCTVAHEKSLSKAAKELFVSQSAVSQSIKQLETQLETRLFNRKSRGVELTAEGKQLYEYADGAIVQLENAQKKFFDMKNLKIGNLRIGASDTVCALLLTNVLKEYHAKYPGVNIALVNHTTTQLVNDLKRGEIDMAFVTLPLKEQSGLVVKNIMNISDCFVVSGKYSFLARRTITLDELEKYPVLMLDKKSSSRRFIDEFLAQKGIFLSPCVELGSIDLLTRFAQIGIGVSVVIEQYVTDKLENGTLQKLQLAEPIPKRAIGLITLKNSAMSSASQKLLQIL